MYDVVIGDGSVLKWSRLELHLLKFLIGSTKVLSSKKHYFSKTVMTQATQWLHISYRKQNDFEKELKSFVDIANEVEDAAVSTAMQGSGLTFDKKLYKANREVRLRGGVGRGVGGIA